jgi:hypothetical protein
MLFWHLVPWLGNAYEYMLPFKWEQHAGFNTVFEVQNIEIVSEPHWFYMINIYVCLILLIVTYLIELFALNKK